MTHPALTQYFDLFKANRELIDLNSAAPLNRKREEAAAMLSETPLPKLGSENYPITDLPEILGADYGMNLGRIGMQVNPSASFRCGVPNMSTALFMMLNDIYTEASTARKALDEGVIAGSLRNMALYHPEIIEKYYGTIADMANPLVALNTMFAQDGFVIFVPKGVKAEKPIQLVNILQSHFPLMAVRRILVIAEDNAEVKLLLCDHSQNTSVQMLSLQTIEVFAGKNSHIEFYDLEESEISTRRLSSLYLHQEADSNVILAGLTLYNGLTRNEYFCRYNAPGSSLKLYGMGIIDNTRRLDTYSVVSHDVGNCHTDELFKYTVDDEAQGAFGGLIYVAPNAVNTEAYQANRNLLSSDKGRMYSKPQLEIYNDDVKCSHGSATGQLDERQLFYMQTRGLDAEAARLLLKQAFMADVIAEIRLDSLKVRLQALVERRFAGLPCSCSGK